MTYQETLAHIYRLGRFGMRPGLNKIKSLLRELGNPQEKIKTIHVAGTNGKGSTASFLASILQYAGYRAGLYTSPHLASFTERIRINGIEITEDEVTGFAETVIDAAPPETTFFEIVTAMAWLYFSEKKVDFAVMETGMGGRFDATNSAEGIISVITPVSLDHCEYLGGTLEEIAFEKAGVIKPGKPVVASLQPAEVRSILERECERRNSPLYRSGFDFSGSWEGDGLRYRGIGINLENLKPGMPGRFQGENAVTALAAAELIDGMGCRIPESAFIKGISMATWPGRFEMLAGEPRILLDGAHNPEGARVLAEELRSVPREKLIVVMGVMADKDTDGIFRPLLPLADSLYAVSSSLERAMPSDRLAAMGRAFGVESLDAGTVARGLEKAMAEARPGDLILVCGSLYITGEARAILFSKSFEPFRG